jgi:hypothetical protein
MTLPPPPPPRSATAVPMQPHQPPLSPPRHGEPLIGATVVRGARKRRGTLLHWFGAGAIAAVLGAGAYFVTRESTTDAVAGSAAPPAVAAPVAARAPTPPPSPPKPVHADPPPPPPPPKPTKVRVKIVTHPPNAIVMLDGKPLGKTPFDETLDADPSKHTIKLRRKGYTTAEIDTALDGDIAQDIALTPRR